METDQEKRLKEALAKLESFLEEHPELEEKQQEIERVLAATQEDKRLDVIMMLLTGKMSELQALLTEIMKKKELN